VRLEITRNWRGLEDAPLPVDQLPIVEALAPIQGTAWRVNQFMLETLRKLVAFGEALDPTPTRARRRDIRARAGGLLRRQTRIFLPL
jgi:hypothetical protein